MRWRGVSVMQAAASSNPWKPPPFFGDSSGRRTYREVDVGGCAEAVCSWALQGCGAPGLAQSDCRPLRRGER
jgi:hypothetical protein